MFGIDQLLEFPYGTIKQFILNEAPAMLEALKDINKSFTDVAKEFDVSITSVQNIFDTRININRQPFTEVLCVDEVYSKHCGYHKYCFITYSPQLDKILDVLPSRHKEDLCGYFGKIPHNDRKKVKYFSMDLYEVYRQVVRPLFHFSVVHQACLTL